MRTHAPIRAYTRVRRHMRARAQCVRTRTHARTHAHVRTHAHARTGARGRARPDELTGPAENVTPLNISTLQPGRTEHIARAGPRMPQDRRKHPGVDNVSSRTESTLSGHPRAISLTKRDDQQHDNSRNEVNGLHTASYKPTVLRKFPRSVPATEPAAIARSAATGNNRSFIHISYKNAQDMTPTSQPTTRAPMTTLPPARVSRITPVYFIHTSKRREVALCCTKRRNVTHRSCRAESSSRGQPRAISIMAYSTGSVISSSMT